MKEIRLFERGAGRMLNPWTWPGDVVLVVGVIAIGFVASRRRHASLETA